MRATLFTSELLMALSGHSTSTAECPLSEVKRVGLERSVMSAMTHNRHPVVESLCFRNLFRGNRNDELISLALHGSSDIRAQLLSKTRDDLHSKSFALREVKVSG